MAAAALIAVWAAFAGDTPKIVAAVLGLRPIEVAAVACLLVAIVVQHQVRKRRRAQAMRESPYWSDWDRDDDDGDGDCGGGDGGGD